MSDSRTEHEISKSRINKRKNKKHPEMSKPKGFRSLRAFHMVGEGGFEPPKALPADLQSVPFGHSGIPPYSVRCGAGGRIRTPDLLITNQLLYRLSYTSATSLDIIAKGDSKVNRFFSFVSVCSCQIEVRYHLIRARADLLPEAAGYPPLFHVDAHI